MRTLKPFALLLRSRRMPAVCWLRQCVIARRPVAADDHTTFSPLRAVATSVSGVDDVRLTFTMFEVRIVQGRCLAMLLTNNCHLQDPIRTAILDLCKLGGIKVSNKLIRHKTTHLVCCIDAGESDKLMNARRWGAVHVVSIDWLLQCIRTGQRAAEAQFQVPADPQAAPVEAAAAAPPPPVVREPVGAPMEAAPAAAPQKPQEEPPDSMVDFLAKLTSVAKATGKRYVACCRSWPDHVTDSRLADARPGRSSILHPAVLPRCDDFAQPLSVEHA